MKGYIEALTFVTRAGYRTTEVITTQNNQKVVKVTLFQNGIIKKTKYLPYNESFPIAYKESILTLYNAITTKK